MVASAAISKQQIVKVAVDVTGSIVFAFYREIFSKLWEANGTLDKNNSELLDKGGANQNLTSEDIEAMKESGINGEAIIDAVIANSETFDSKTNFSQVYSGPNLLDCSMLLKVVS